MSRMNVDPDTAIGGRVTRFPSTRASLIASASHDCEATRDEALDALTAAYWKPVYKYIRIKWRRDNEDAKDLTQAFLSDLLTGSTLANFDSARASFRTYLRVCVDGFVMHANQAAGRLKRGAGRPVLSFDTDEVESELPVNPSLSMDDLFHREWQRQMFALGIDDLRRFAHETGKDVPFEVFEAHDLDEEPPTYATLAGRFDLPVSTITNHLAWARRELRRLVLARVRAITPTDAEFARDVRSLFGRNR
jgi:DNA-directed RNA polymerase specialized sigma24 family protein